MTDRVTPREHAKLLKEAEAKVVATSEAMRDVAAGCVTTPRCGGCARCAFAAAVDSLRELRAVTFNRGRPKTPDGELTGSEADFLRLVAVIYGEVGVWPSVRAVYERAGFSRQAGFALAGRLIAKGQLVKEGQEVRLPMAGLLP